MAAFSMQKGITELQIRQNKNNLIVMEAIITTEPDSQETLLRDYLSSGQGARYYHWWLSVV